MSGSGEEEKCRDGWIGVGLVLKKDSEYSNLTSLWVTEVVMDG